MDKLLHRIAADHPQLRFAAGDSFCWSPATNQVQYERNASGVTAVFSLLHEVGHALLQHEHYKLDFELLELEVAAWERARELAGKYKIQLDEDHVQDCLDTYRDWLYRRSICPSCTTRALQLDDSAEYQCHNCRTTWRVATSRFCRPYRHNTGRAPANTVFSALQP